MNRRIIEIGFEINSQADYDFLENLLGRLNIPFYIEPPGNWVSLEDLECACEGK